MGFKHLFFDLDNTLLDFSFASHNAFNDLLNDYGRENNNYYQIYHTGNVSVWKEFEEGKISALDLRAKRFDLFLEQMGWSGDGAEWNSVYMKHVVHHTKFVDGAADLVIKLKKNFDLHIVTNGLREAQRPRIAMSGLEPIIRSITVSDEIGAAKPQAEFFHIAAKNAGIENKEEILMIGDSYSSDIKGGSNYGIKTCWFNHNRIKMDSKIHDFEIHHISDLEKILD